ncbi:GNAT family N-acetyltransferase [Hoyosella rhizosphaerae]|uniref:Acetyltransferase n=1 Tax=Hoyosella rhizosphaerae TaxID=1755582 RepID=A0A916U2X5_9ACTN|nr:GNAT family N-acetyltransferase [Hoyosella rhizosphaerae]MBN4926649.1 GNAT family N-acetyltransferase [Hoyosella rhizosphaerae]GGC57574.1 acetyltransferase [Hoyosella rhizosphaerae]
MQDNPETTVRPSKGEEEYSDLVEIWRSAVRATHDFLQEEDFGRIEENLASMYFPAVALIVAERDGAPVGFAGVAEGNLEMLFVTDDVRGGGVGTLLLREAISGLGVTKVDVNEQNEGAYGFYLNRGFVLVGRDELDGDGRPYPTLHLELSQ